MLDPPVTEMHPQTAMARERTRHARGDRCAVGLLAATILASFACGCGRSTQRTGDAARATVTIGTEPPESRRPALDPARAKQVVARIGRRSLTLATVERSAAAEALQAKQAAGSASVPTGLILDAPAYRSCVAFLAAHPIGRPNTTPSRQALREACKKEHEGEVASTLTALVRDAWLYEEAARRHIAVSRSAVDRLIPKVLGRPEVLRALGVSVADQRFMAGAERLRELLYRATLPAFAKIRRNGNHETFRMATEVDLESERFDKAMATRWSAKTTCSPGFVVSGCRGFRGPP